METVAPRFAPTILNIIFYDYHQIFISIYMAPNSFRAGGRGKWMSALVLKLVVSKIFQQSRELEKFLKTHALPRLALFSNFKCTTAIESADC